MVSQHAFWPNLEHAEFGSPFVRTSRGVTLDPKPRDYVLAAFCSVAHCLRIKFSGEFLHWSCCSRAPLPWPKIPTHCGSRNITPIYEHRIPMRDGVRLFTRVYVPKDSTQKWPILMTRTPYALSPYGTDNYNSRAVHFAPSRKTTSFSLRRMCAAGTDPKESTCMCDR